MEEKAVSDFAAQQFHLSSGEAALYKSVERFYD
jgi:hypothetical protein